VTTLRIGDDGSSAISEALAALFRELRPDWGIHVSAVSNRVLQAPRVIPVEVVGKGRWLAILLDENDFTAAADSLSRGARAVVPITANLEELERALIALDGEANMVVGSGVAAGIAREMLDRSLNPANQQLPRLTNRESEILSLVAAGLTNQEIAARLSLSVNTVRSHLQALSTKLNARSRAKLVASAWGAGLWSPGQPGSVAS
jgi:DNA-binding NarL/FixJ family response regulator